MFDDSVVHEFIKVDLKVVVKVFFGFGDVNNCFVFKELEK